MPPMLLKLSGSWSSIPKKKTVERLPDLREPNDAGRRVRPPRAQETRGLRGEFIQIFEMKTVRTSEERSWEMTWPAFSMLSFWS